MWEAREARTVLLLVLVMTACSSGDDSEPAPVCDASPKPSELEPIEGSDELEPSCPEGWFYYVDRTCGPPSSPGCASVGDCQCYRRCETDDDCCGEPCGGITIFGGSDAPRDTVEVCGGQTLSENRCGG